MSIRSALLLAAGIIGLSLALNWAVDAGHLSASASRRISGAAMGMVVVAFANLMPKTLEPLCAGSSPTRVQALQRFSGWALVLGGLGYSLAWLVAPFEHASFAAMAILGTSLLLVVARLVWTLMTRGDRPPAES